MIFLVNECFGDIQFLEEEYVYFPLTRVFMDEALIPISDYLLIAHANLNVGRLFKKIELSESIRYASGDPIEQWLHALLCLDVTSSIPPINRLGFLNVLEQRENRRKMRKKFRLKFLPPVFFRW